MNLVPDTPAAVALRNSGLHTDPCDLGKMQKAVLYRDGIIERQHKEIANLREKLAAKTERLNWVCYQHDALQASCDSQSKSLRSLKSNLKKLVTS